MQPDTMRSAHLDLIEDNARDVLIRRVEKTRSANGGWQDSDPFYVGRVRARVYRAGGGQFAARAQESMAGIIESDQGFGLLCADTMTTVNPLTGDVTDPPAQIPTSLKYGPDVTDTFSTEQGDFEIVTVFAHSDEGEVWGYDCIVKRST